MVDGIVQYLNRNMHLDHNIENWNNKAMLRSLISSQKCGMWKGLEDIECSKDIFRNCRSCQHNNRMNAHNILQIDILRGYLWSVAKAQAMDKN